MKIKLVIVATFVAILLISAFLVQEISTNKKIIEKDYAIILNTNCDLSTEVNKLILEEVWLDSDLEKEQLERLIDIIYHSSRSGSNYDINDKVYQSKFESLNFFEEYTYNIKMILSKKELNNKDRKYVEMMVAEIDDLQKQMSE
jgi:hypothetical protein